MSDPEDSHYCSENHARKKKPCALCLEQRQKRRDERERADGKPTLRHQPFARLLGPK